MSTSWLKCWHELPGRDEREILRGLREREQHGQPCWDLWKQRWWVAPSFLFLKNQSKRMRCCREHLMEKMFSKIIHLFLFLFFSSTVKKKYGAGLKFSNLMNIGKKKASLLESPENCVDTSGEWRSTVVAYYVGLKIPKYAPIVAPLLHERSYCLFCGSYWMMSVSAADILSHLSILIFFHVALW